MVVPSPDGVCLPSEGIFHALHPGHRPRAAGPGAHRDHAGMRAIRPPTWVMDMLKRRY
ncbi:hypothetical protein AMETH_5329 [Amycolatopsis methanolica 239]|uniref:Uncharacterized protein n=1 Tax=Amycolatopsis methanolica 239 TaxID=1068978 RepID=A0A076N2P6_AMYME|nr:hypothetical protein AMETH_5329 [Amycolatopsis methanolica 239]